MAIFVVLWFYLLNTKLSCLQKKNIGHTNCTCTYLQLTYTQKKSDELRNRLGRLIFRECFRQGDFLSWKIFKSHNEIELGYEAFEMLDSKKRKCFDYKTQSRDECILRHIEKV